MTTATGSRRSSGGSGTSKVRLDRDSIVAAGLEIASDTTNTTISVRDLGARLGTDPTAIYRHFRNKEALMQALLDELHARSVAAVTADPDEWRERLRQLAQATLVTFMAYPAIAVEAVVLTTHGPGELDAVELMLDALTRAGLAGDDLVRHYALMASYVLSTASGIARGRSGRPTNDDEPGTWFDGPILGDPRTHPRVAELAGRFADLEDRDLFALGVDVVIQSAERTAAASAASD